MEAAGFVEGQDEQGLFPLGAGTEGFIDLFDEHFAGGDQARGVHRGGADAAARGVEEAEGGQVASGRVDEELGEVNDVVLKAGVVCRLEPRGLGSCAADRVVVVPPLATALG